MKNIFNERHSQLPMLYFSDLNMQNNKEGYIDVGDGCWGPNVLVTSLGCCRRVTSEAIRVRVKLGLG